ncbi:MAG: hypothetical protein ABIP03_01285 [Aquihabitans sp.]
MSDPALPETIDHEILLTLARKSQAAASDGDPTRVEASSLRLLEAFFVHVRAEQPAMLQLAPGEARMMLRGQQRVIDAIVDLIIAAGSDSPCNCARLSEDLIVRLTLQSEDESHHLAP